MIPLLLFVPDANNAFAFTVSNACASVSPLTARSIGGHVNGMYRYYNEDESEYELWNISIDITIATDHVIISGYATDYFREE